MWFTAVSRRRATAGTAFPALVRASARYQATSGSSGRSWRASARTSIASSKFDESYISRACFIEIGRDLDYRSSDGTVSARVDQMPCPSA